MFVVVPAVLGHRLQENDVISLPLKKDQKVYPHVSCASVQRQQLKTMFEHFEEVTMKKDLNLFFNTALFPKKHVHVWQKLCFFDNSIQEILVNFSSKSFF